MDFELLISYIIASVLLTIMPGPDNLYVLAESITKGHKNGIAISAGLCLGVLVHTLAAATGISIIIQNSAVAYSVLKYLGAAYLFYLAYQATKEKQQTIDLTSSNTESEVSWFPLVRKGFFMNVLNPKVSLFFIAFLPQFITRDGMNITVQMIIMGGIFLIQAFIIFSLIALLSGKLSNRINSPRFWIASKWSKVLILGVLGISLALSRN